MKENPLVSVVCLCFNHERFVREAVVSVVNQSYRNIQIIVADDASTDASVKEIEKLKSEYPSLELLLLRENVGNCKAFNAAFRLAKGDYIIDFATDDVMMTDRIEKQVIFFKKQHPSIGVVFTDAVYITETGTFIRNHFEYLIKKGLLSNIPQGDVYREVLSTFFIPGPTVMAKTEVYAALNGYDETLSYEDFDFWVRSARNYRYAFLNERLTRIRKVKTSMSAGLYMPGDKQLHSTYLICQKARGLNRDEGDMQALIQRVRYELRQSILSGNHDEAKLFFNLLEELNGVRWLEQAMNVVGKTRIPLSPIRKLYHKLKYD